VNNTPTRPKNRMPGWRCAEDVRGVPYLEWAKETRFLGIIEILIYLHQQYNFFAQLRADTKTVR
jgi:hypothetical protein